MTVIPPSTACAITSANAMPPAMATPESRRLSARTIDATMSTNARIATVAAASRWLCSTSTPPCILGNTCPKHNGQSGHASDERVLCTSPPSSSRMNVHPVVMMAKRRNDIYCSLLGGGGFGPVELELHFGRLALDHGDLARLGAEALVPRLDVIGADGDILDGELAVLVADREVRVVLHPDESGHPLVDVALELEEHAVLRERLLDVRRPRHLRDVEQRARALVGVDVVQDGIAVADLELLPVDDGLHARHVHAVVLRERRLLGGR